ncbi:MAG TPA: DAK2 domain-containing protein, partial [Dongiaceae bacterium]|nr:DAK2 domain-containing protein [Dongiaceae bacterium]
RPDVDGSFERAFGEAVSAVGARGKSQAGQKSLLDVLVPLHACLAAPPAPAALRYEHLAAIARQAAEATIPMCALCGRAAFLGERSIGHMDPGARSASLMIEAVCNVLSKEGRQPC